MKNLLLPIILAAALCSCATKPTIYKAPDTTRLDQSVKRTDESAHRMHKAVTAAKETHAQVRTEVAAVKGLVKHEGEVIESLKPKLEDLLRVSPPELRDQVDAARMQVESLAEDHTSIASRIETVSALQGTEGGQLEEANAADKQHLLDLADTKAEVTKIKAEAAELARKATEESEAKAAAQNEVRELKSKNWIRRAFEGLAAIAILVVGFLYFTGRLTLSAAAKSVIP